MVASAMETGSVKRLQMPTARDTHDFLLQQLWLQKQVFDQLDELFYSQN